MSSQDLQYSRTPVSIFSHSLLSSLLPSVSSLPPLSRVPLFVTPPARTFWTRLPSLGAFVSFVCRMAGGGVDLLFGPNRRRPMLIGVFLSTIFYGVMSVQMFVYYQTYKRDIPWIRYFVLYLFPAESAGLFFQLGIVYEPLILRYGQPRALIFSPLLLPGDAISIVLVSTPIQIFTAWRIRVITGSRILLAFLSLFAVVSFAGGLGVTVFAATRNQYRQFQSFSGVVAMWLASSAVCDILIAGILTYSLTRRKTGFTAVDGQINRIIRLTVQTGAITALADLVLFLSFPTTTLQFIPDFPLSKFYSICLVSTLNARSRGRSDEEQQRLRLPNALFDSTENSASNASGGVSGTRKVNLLSSGGGMGTTTALTMAMAMSSGWPMKPVNVYSATQTPSQALGMTDFSATTSTNTLVAPAYPELPLPLPSTRSEVKHQPHKPYRPRSQSQPPAVSFYDVQHASSPVQESAGEQSERAYAWQPQPTRLRAPIHNQIQTQTPQSHTHFRDASHSSTSVGGSYQHMHSRNPSDAQIFTPVHSRDTSRSHWQTHPAPIVIQPRPRKDSSPVSPWTTSPESTLPSVFVLEPNRAAPTGARERR
ncbi:hypothetical protein MKEN_00562400 [Mycena kentingensis (nom. inval.)]|nr:hypothetical protein MKEN_00562400 [Mycena kentingensis (nom. inval.)]